MPLPLETVGRAPSEQEVEARRIEAQASALEGVDVDRACALWRLADSVRKGCTTTAVAREASAQLRRAEVPAGDPVWSCFDETDATAEQLAPRTPEVVAQQPRLSLSLVAVSCSAVSLAIRAS